MEIHLDGTRGKTSGIVIDDVRFPNEALLVRRRSGLLVRMDSYPGYVPHLTT